MADLDNTFASIKHRIVFTDQGLVPTIVQDIHTRQVLMLAYSNLASIVATIDHGEAHFFSRSRQQLWHKGATSGNRMLVRRVAIDCDQDTLLYFVEPLGPACHTGQTTCFYQTYGAKEDSLPDLSTSKREKFDLNELFTVIAERKHHPKPESYTNKLFNAGEDEILKKVGEEAVEVILAAKSQGQVRLIEELADWVYHMLVLMAQKDLTIENLFEELANRHNLK